MCDPAKISSTPLGQNPRLVFDKMDSIAQLRVAISLLVPNKINKETSNEDVQTSLQNRNFTEPVFLVIQQSIPN